MSVLVRALALLAFVVLLVGGTVVTIGVRRVRRVYDLPYPAVTRAIDPGEIARGGRLFRTSCLGCHSGPDGERPIGARVPDAPSFLGEIWAPNLTSDMTAGIGAWTDADIARLLRNGIGRDGRYAATMPRFARLADVDIAAIVGFLRSSDPMVAPYATPIPRSDLTLAGTLVLAYAAGVDTKGEQQVLAPHRAATADYGRYLASAVYACVECHTDGYAQAPEKLRSPVLLGGGLGLRTPRGEPIYSANLTREPETGLPNLDEGTFTKILTTGIGHDGLPLRPPMPVFRFLDAADDTEHVEARALFAFTRSVAPVNRHTPQGPPREALRADSPPERLFATLGCATCHGDGAPRHGDLKTAAAKPIETIVDNIRNPEKFRARTPMPTYAAAVDDFTARKLATWIQTTAGKSSNAAR